MPNSASASEGGFLLVKKASKVPGTGTSSWKRRYFWIKGSTLYYHKKAQSGDKDVREINLLICTVKPVLRRAADNLEADAKGRFCFDLISPYRTLTLATESEADIAFWVAAIRMSIEATVYGLGDRPGSSVPGAPDAAAADAGAPQHGGGKAAALSILRSVSAKAGNDVCADCSDASTSPDWAVLPYGTLVCIQCSGIHRSLGVHISKVRSISLDTWTAEMAGTLAAIGNREANTLLEARAPLPSLTLPTASSSHAVKEAWIRAKYEQRACIERPVPAEQLPAALAAAAATNKALPLLALLLQLAPSTAALDAKPAPRSAAPLPADGLAPMVAPMVVVGNADTDAADAAAAVIDVADAAYADAAADALADTHNRRRPQPPTPTPTSAAEKQAEASGASCSSDTKPAAELPVWPMRSREIGEGGAATHVAAQYDASISLELLLLAGASLELPGPRGRTPCHVACAAGAELCVALLLKRNADCTAADANNDTPLTLARASGHAGCEALLLSAIEERERAAASRVNLRGLTSSDDEPVTPVSSRHSFGGMVRSSTSSISKRSSHTGGGGGVSSSFSRAMHRRTKSAAPSYRPGRASGIETLGPIPTKAAATSQLADAATTGSAATSVATSAAGTPVATRLERVLSGKELSSDGDEGAAEPTARTPQASDLPPPPSPASRRSSMSVRRLFGGLSGGRRTHRRSLSGA